MQFLSGFFKKRHIVLTCKFSLSTFLETFLMATCSSTTRNELGITTLKYIIKHHSENFNECVRPYKQITILVFQFVILHCNKKRPESPITFNFKLIFIYLFFSFYFILVSFPVVAVFGTFSIRQKPLCYHGLLCSLLEFKIVCQTFLYVLLVSCV